MFDLLSGRLPLWALRSGLRRLRVPLGVPYKSCTFCGRGRHSGELCVHLCVCARVSPLSRFLCCLIVMHTQSTVCGPESFTPDHKPLVGECPELRGFFVGCGLNSAGIMYSGGFGSIAILSHFQCSQYMWIGSWVAFVTTVLLCFRCGSPLRQGAGRLGGGRRARN